jgi:hypothetical protein
MFQAMTGGFDQAFKAWEPTAKGAMRANLEFVALANRRAQAYLDIPNRLAQCRTPQDLYGEQARFWQTAFAQYQESSQQVLSIWSAAIPAFNMLGFERAAETVRDYITFPEPREPATMDRAEPVPASRRAA